MRDIDINNLKDYMEKTKDKNLEFHSCNRIILPDGSMTEEHFFASLKIPFEVIALPQGMICKPMERHSFSMYMNGQWFLLKAWNELYENRPAISKLDVSIFNRQILENIFKIEDILEDERLLLMDNTFSVTELMQIADRTGGVLFLLYPISREEIMACIQADADIPPMSFCVEMLA